MKILYLHGYQGSPNWGRVEYLESLGHEVITPQIDYDKEHDFFLNLLEDISKRFGVTTNFLMDASKYFIKKDLAVNLSFYSLHKDGQTYYGKFGFKPIKDWAEDLQWKLLLNIPIKSAQDELDFVTMKLKKIKTKNKAEWYKTINELSDIFPSLYYRQIK